MYSSVNASENRVSGAMLSAFPSFLRGCTQKSGKRAMCEGGSREYKSRKGGQAPLPPNGGCGLPAHKTYRLRISWEAIRKLPNSFSYQSGLWIWEVKDVEKKTFVCIPEYFYRYTWLRFKFF